MPNTSKSSPVLYFSFEGENEQAKLFNVCSCESRFNKQIRAINQKNIDKTIDKATTEKSGSPPIDFIDKIESQLIFSTKASFDNTVSAFSRSK